MLVCGGFEKEIRTLRQGLKFGGTYRGVHCVSVGGKCVDLHASSLQNMVFCRLMLLFFVDSFPVSHAGAREQQKRKL